MGGALTVAEPSSRQPKLIQNGDLVIMYERFDSMKVIKVDKKDSFTSKLGTFQMKVRRLKIVLTVHCIGCWCAWLLSFGVIGRISHL